jgi:hypothetical protein
MRRIISKSEVNIYVSAPANRQRRRKTNFPFVEESVFVEFHKKKKNYRKKSSKNINVN